MPRTDLALDGLDARTVLLAGQAYDFASEFGSDHLARRAARDGDEGPKKPTWRPWMDQLADFDPRRVLFVHDGAVCEPTQDDC